MRTSKFPIRYQLGIVYFEVVLASLVVSSFLVGAQYLWRSAELEQIAVDAVRFAAWERTVWEPSNNDTEKFALHKTDQQLGKDVVMRQLSTPAAWRNVRTSLPAVGIPAAASSANRSGRYDVLHTTVKEFIKTTGEPNEMISVETASDWPFADEKEFRGMDPTRDSVTSLSLDRNTLRTVNLKLQSNYRPRLLDNKYYNSHAFFLIETKKQFSLVTNSWAASPPVSFVRDRQLMPFSTGDEMSGTRANRLSLGFAPIWAAVGGPSGFGGQYLSRQLGGDARMGNDLFTSSGESLTFDPSNPLDSLPIMPQTQQAEYFNPNNVSQWHHRHTMIIAKTADNAREPDTKAYNSNIGKLKYRAISRKNPIETYFTR